MLMSKIEVIVEDASINHQEARVLLDSGVQISFLIENCRKRLGLPRKYFCIAVQAVANI